jgi:Tfp pilus assembly pilus retraction ATPase PilT
MIYSAIETGAKYGMIPMDKALVNLVQQNLVAFEVALAKAHDRESFRVLCARPGAVAA